MRDFNCKDCRAAFVDYMVNDELWASAGLGPRDLCCQSCLSNRLGRPLTNADYTLAPVNFLNVPGFATEDNYHRLDADDTLNLAWFEMLEGGECLKCRQPLRLHRVESTILRGFPLKVPLFCPPA